MPQTNIIDEHATKAKLHEVFKSGNFTTKYLDTLDFSVLD